MGKLELQPLKGKAKRKAKRANIERVAKKYDITKGQARKGLRKMHRADESYVSQDYLSSVSRKSALNMLGMTGKPSKTVGRINKIKNDLDVKPVDLGVIPASDFTKAKKKLVEEYGGPDNPDYRMDKGDLYWSKEKGKMRSGYTEYPEDAGDIEPRYLGKNWDNPINHNSASGRDHIHSKYHTSYKGDATFPKDKKKGGKVVKGDHGSKKGVSKKSPLNNYQSPSGNQYFSNREDFQRLQNDITGAIQNVADQRTGSKKAKAKEKFDIGMNKAKTTASNAFTKPLGNYTVSVDDLAMKASKGFGVSRKKGLWDNIHAKRKRIKAGSGEKMRKPGSKGAPSAKDLKDSQTKK